MLISKYAKGLPELCGTQVRNQQVTQICSIASGTKALEQSRTTCLFFALLWEDKDDGDFFFPLNFCFKQKEFNMHSPQKLTAGNQT